MLSEASVCPAALRQMWDAEASQSLGPRKAGGAGLGARALVQAFSPLHRARPPTLTLPPRPHLRTVDFQLQKLGEQSGFTWRLWAVPQPRGQASVPPSPTQPHPAPCSRIQACKAGSRMKGSGSRCRAGPWLDDVLFWGGGCAPRRGCLGRRRSCLPAPHLGPRASSALQPDLWHCRSAPSRGTPPPQGPGRG